MKKLSYLIVLTLILGLVLTGCFLSNVGQVPATEQSGVSEIAKSPVFNKIYGDVTLSQWQWNNFPDVWDLTQCNLTLSYTIDMSEITTDGWAVTQVGLREVGASNIDPNLKGGWMQSNYIFGSSNPNSQNLNDFHLLSVHGWDTNYQKYDAEDADTLVTPYWSGDNYGFWFDRDGVDPWQDDDPSTPSPGGSSVQWGVGDGVTYNTAGVYVIVITYHANDATTGTMFATINGIQQGLYIGGGKDAEPEFYPAGRSFTGDMTKMQVFYGRGGIDGNVEISNITVYGCPFWDECTVDLIAGQNEVAGMVTVDDDGVNLLITYKTTGDWEMTETHLYVGKTDPKELTSAPGQFPYSVEHDPTVTTYTYTIPISEIDSYKLNKGKKWVADNNPGIGPGDQIYIAAHAEVIRPIIDCYEPVWQIGDIETYGCNSGANLTNYANEFNWRKSNDGGITYDALVGDCEQGPGLGKNEPAYANPFIVETTLTDEFPYNSNFSKPYATNFDVQWEGSLPFGGLLTISWSPGQSASEKKVVSEDGNALAIFTAQGLPKPGEGWFMNIYPLVEHSVVVDPLTDGVHTINFQHTQGDGTFWDWVRLEKICVEEESAWGDGIQIREDKNWAMYFEYPCD